MNHWATHSFGFPKPCADQQLTDGHSTTRPLLLVFPSPASAQSRDSAPAITAAPGRLSLGDDYLRAGDVVLKSVLRRRWPGRLCTAVSPDALTLTAAACRCLSVFCFTRWLTSSRVSSRWLIGSRGSTCAAPFVLKMALHYHKR